MFRSWINHNLLAGGLAKAQYFRLDINNGLNNLFHPVIFLIVYDATNQLPTK